MNKLKVLKTVNVIMAIDFSCVVVSAMLVDVIPQNVYQTIHPFLGYTFLVFVICHVFLNFAWIKANFFKKK
jgi:hypothetical protein